MELQGADEAWLPLPSELQVSAFPQEKAQLGLHGLCCRVVLNRYLPTADKGVLPCGTLSQQKGKLRSYRSYRSRGPCDKH
jgi:hypothetical protein